MTENRNSTAGTAQLDLFGQAPMPGVGARQADPGPPDRGGGYLDTCGSANDGASDPRLAELAHLGLPRAWLMIAELIGFDAWLNVWRMLSSAEFDSWIRRETGGTRMPQLRSYDSYLRYQRNRYIEALAARGMKAGEIQRAVARNLREPLDEKHVLKIMKRR